MVREAKRVPVEELRPGMYVRLNLPWYEHPFTWSAFVLKSQTEISLIRALGVELLEVDPAKSRISFDAPLQAPTLPTGTQPQAKTEETDLFERANRERREKIQRCEAKFKKSVRSVREVMRDIRHRPAQAFEQAQTLIEGMSGVLQEDGETVVNLMNGRTPNDPTYHHGLNVSVLAMMLGRSCELGDEELVAVGLGGLFHDIGKSRIPSSVLHKRGELTKAEQSFIEQHPAYGVEMAQDIDEFPPEVLSIIAQHHEAIDGSGYPEGLKREEITRLTRIVQIANVYDNSLNNYDPGEALPPHEAVAALFTKHKGLDPDLVQVFVRDVGVYPPGSVVQLSDNRLGIVVSTNTGDVLRPTVMLYDPSLPRTKAPLLDLGADQSVAILSGKNPEDLPSDVYAYLSPRSQMSYFVDVEPND